MRQDFLRCLKWKNPTLREKGKAGSGGGRWIDLKNPLPKDQDVGVPQAC